MPSVKGIKLKRSRVRSCITRAQNACSSFDETTTLEELETRLASISDYWQQYVEMEDELCEMEHDEGADAQVNDQESFEAYESKYFAIRSTLLKTINERKAKMPKAKDSLDVLAGQHSTLLNQLGNMVPKPNDVALPKIIIPTFFGEYNKWTTFRDLFLGSVDNKANLTKTQKFYYLISFLDGEAANLVKNIPLDEDNYLEAWDKLESRYDRPHLCAYAYIKNFYSLLPVTTTSHKAIRKLIDGADECLRGLNAINMNGRDPWLIYSLLSKLDNQTRLHWSEEVGTESNVSINLFLEFLEKRYTYMESNEMLGAVSSSKSSSVRSNISRTNEQECIKCKQPHTFYQCTEFKNLDIESRRQFIKDNALCFNCLKPGHRLLNCKSPNRCNQCKKRHHTLVHFETQNSSSDSHNGNNIQGSELLNDLAQSHVSVLNNNQVTYSNQGSILNTDLSAHAEPFLSTSSLLTNHTVANQHSQIILPTAVVRIKDINGNFLKIRALIDSGSQVSFITESCVQVLRLKRKNARLSITGVASSNAGVTKGQVKVDVYSRLNSEKVSVNAFILNRITSDVPTYSNFKNSSIQILPDNLADPDLHKAGQIDLLLGADIVWSVLRDGKINLNGNSLHAINSLFGWIISGECNTNIKNSTLASYTVSMDVDAMLQRFFESEDIFNNDGKLRLNVDDPAELHFRETHSKSEDNKYIVELPFKTSRPCFHNTLAGAVSRLHGMEKRFNKYSELKKQYVEFMRDYEQLGHMEKISSAEIDKKPQFYLPHHAVLKPDSSTTKLRVVFDGSYKDSFGHSLNEMLLIGPPIQRDLFGVSLRFRKFSYVFTADITKMFRQIWVAEKDRDYQRIVWRYDSNKPIDHYRLCTVTYGTSSAPYLSVRVLQQLAMDNQEKYPIAASIILNNIYVDDVMTGSNSHDDLLLAKNELVSLLDLGGFKLRKWSANSTLFLENIPPIDRETPIPESGSNVDDHIKLLGLYWNPLSDTYSFRIANQFNTGKITKRLILSDIARIFDVFGFLSPSTILMKILLQKLWLKKTSWDETVSSDIYQEWLQIRGSIKSFQELSIQRNINLFSEFEIHCFSDASSLAYSAVIYSVHRKSNGETLVNIIAAKAKVAPVKVLSIPRLELCAATLLSRLYSSVKSALNLNPAKLYAWTDSQIVLHWLSSSPRTWKVFVSHRTDEILNTIPRKFWHYVNTKENPADCASRGVFPCVLIKHDLWWKGPAWLKLPESKWPQHMFNQVQPEDNMLEKRKTVLAALVKNKTPLLTLSENISNWFRLLRIIAYIKRVLDRPSRRASYANVFISLKELHTAKIMLVIDLQRSSFSSNIDCLQRNKGLPKDNCLNKLSPFLDKDGLLREGGRLQGALVSYNIKHPIIIPKCHVAELIVRDLHERYLHVGASELFTITRQQFWILGARNMIRSIIFKCKRCFMLRRQTSEQLMGNLPIERVQPYRPFYNSGCDFAGPLTIKMTNCKRPRICKSYICLFICLSTKALHLELVTDLSSEAFILAFKRFISRRGKCCNLYTDNATNFQGANRILSDMAQMLLDETVNKDIAASLAKDGTTFHFRPPSSPHFGGIWESNVKSVKLHLKRVVGSTLLSFEEMYTILTQIEAILNSRPLCSISDHDLNPLTPSHFITGEPLTAMPEPDGDLAPVSRLNHWKFLQQMVQGFWKRWSTEYITSLQQRPKWQHHTKNFSVGDLVVLKEPSLPPTKWLLGRIIAVHPGLDSKVRYVTIQTEKNIYKRPITKIALLPLN